MARAIPISQVDPQVIRDAEKRLGVKLTGGGRKKGTLADIRNAPEHQIQSTFIAWARLDVTLRDYPELDDLYAVPNFHLPPTTKTNQFWAAYFNEEGRKKGQLDLVIPHARGGFHHCYLESKSIAGTMTVDQAKRAAALIKAGNRVYVCRSAEALKNAAIEYLTSGHTDYHTKRFIRRVRATNIIQVR